MKILILEPYFTGSHTAWAEGYVRHSKHDVQILSMSGRYWKWRMHGGAVTLAGKFLESDLNPDLLLATDMLDLTTFLALTRKKTAATPCAVYFHENQLTYPWSPEDRDVIHNRDRHYGFINYTSALSSAAVLFNSRYHMDSFLSALKLFLKNFPDFNEIETVEVIMAKSFVLSLGLDLQKFDTNVPKPEDTVKDDRPPLILWNHRWEYDKNPQDFFRALYLLADCGLNFEVAVLGENFSNQPDEFLNAKKVLGKRIKHFGFVRDMSIYAGWLWKADIVPVTSNQDFFGASLVEAMYCNCFPILPKRLAYPELIPEDLHQKVFYKDFDGLLNLLETTILNIDKIRKQGMRAFVGRFAWDKMAPIYDAEMQRVAQNRLPL
ncbi:MAG: DUF3524 domain-containing protein [Thermodesulfobacteriota bacterium]